MKPVVSPNCGGLAETFTQTNPECAFEDCPDNGTETITAAMRFSPRGHRFDCTLRLCAEHHRQIHAVRSTCSITFTN